MKRIALALALLSMAGFGFAERIHDVQRPEGPGPEGSDRNVQMHPTNEGVVANADGASDEGEEAGTKSIMAVQQLVNHGGPTITHAKVVSIFWGSQWGTNANPNSTALSMMSFFSSFGTTPEYNTITQYSGIQQNNLTNAYWVDTTNPPTNVTDALLIAEVKKYLAANGVDTSTIYEVFLPSTSYSSFGTSTSCGGPHLTYCAYHSNFSYNGSDVKYASMPYPSCGGCQATGFTTVQNFQHFACHETREAVTDPDGNAWYDRRGNEADDKCAWSPAPFIGTGGFGYQWEWSNANRACIKTR
jgi:hypothetical protein